MDLLARAVEQRERKAHVAARGRVRRHAVAATSLEASDARAAGVFPHLDAKRDVDVRARTRRRRVCAARVARRAALAETKLDAAPRERLARQRQPRLRLAGSGTLGGEARGAAAGENETHREARSREGLAPAPCPSIGHHRIPLSPPRTAGSAGARSARARTSRSRCGRCAGSWPRRLRRPAR